MALRLGEDGPLDRNLPAQEFHLYRRVGSMRAAEEMDDKFERDEFKRRVAQAEVETQTPLDQWVVLAETHRVG